MHTTPYNAWTGETMAETLRIEQDLIQDLLARLSDKSRKGKEAAIEALAVSTEDDDWRTGRADPAGRNKDYQGYAAGKKRTHRLFGTADYYRHCRYRGDRGAYRRRRYCQS